LMGGAIQQSAAVVNRAQGCYSVRGPPWWGRARLGGGRDEMPSSCSAGSRRIADLMKPPVGNAPDLARPPIIVNRGRRQQRATPTITTTPKRSCLPAQGKPATRHHGERQAGRDPDRRGRYFLLNAAKCPLRPAAPPSRAASRLVMRAHPAPPASRPASSGNARAATPLLKSGGAAALDVEECRRCSSRFTTAPTAAVQDAVCDHP